MATKAADPTSGGGSGLNPGGRARGAASRRLAGKPRAAAAAGGASGYFQPLPGAAPLETVKSARIASAVTALALARALPRPAELEGRFALVRHIADCCWRTRAGGSERASVGSSRFYFIYIYI